MAVLDGICFPWQKGHSYEPASLSISMMQNIPARKRRKTAAKRHNIKIVLSHVKAMTMTAITKRRMMTTTSTDDIFIRYLSFIFFHTSVTAMLFRHSIDDNLTIWTYFQ